MPSSIQPRPTKQPLGLLNPNSTITSHLPPSSLKPPHSTRKPKSFEPLKRVLPISTDGSDPEQSETEPERSTSRNQKEARTQNDRSNPTIPSQLNNELSTTETGPTAC
ncbi:hypothetical protein PGT21_027024 [Puccinia graminis f. sp. tritici]|uniref:Uncharacterized protein n=1 Tax=Puccinia graminis f. sp. tritici TaxID=56615 RepID=A0A5B0N3P8_PUCGR|nr:hypothetical protein PGT21_027024 [Puccinia graminis f. sp. tritici]